MQLFPPVSFVGTPLSFACLALSGQGGRRRHAVAGGLRLKVASITAVMFQWLELGPVATPAREAWNRHVSQSGPVPGGRRRPALGGQPAYLQPFLSPPRQVTLAFGQSGFQVLCHRVEKRGKGTGAQREEDFKGIRHKHSWSYF